MTGRWLAYWSFNWCTGEEAYGYGDVSNASFSGNLNQASARESLPFGYASGTIGSYQSGEIQIYQY